MPYVLAFLGALVLCDTDPDSCDVQALSGPVMDTSPDAESVRRAEAGELETVNARWWGFAPEDSTEPLQRAIDSGAKTVIVPCMEKPWILRPVRLRSRLKLVFERGVVVQAKEGEYKGKNDSLFAAMNETDISLQGHGARMVMRKEDYQSEAYEKAEWRMGVSLRGCSNVRIVGLRIEKTGGDGIYIGATKEQPYSKKVHIQEVECVDNHRQGISVISAEDLIIEDCLLAGTSGTPPAGGIDLEPNSPDERLVNCHIRNCMIENNDGPGILIYLGAMTNPSESVKAVSICFENCRIRGGKNDGVCVAGITDHGPDGEIEFKNCVIENTQRAGIAISGKSLDRAAVRFINCDCRNVFTSDGEPSAPVYLGRWDVNRARQTGGIDFVHCSIYDDKGRSPLFADHGGNESVFSGVKGTIYVSNPKGVLLPDWGPGSEEIDLQLIQFKD